MPNTVFSCGKGYMKFLHSHGIRKKAYIKILLKTALMEMASRCVTEEPKKLCYRLQKIPDDIFSFLGWWKVGFCLFVHSKRINLANT